jgi:hypothetical protein
MATANSPVPGLFLSLLDPNGTHCPLSRCEADAGYCSAVVGGAEAALLGAIVFGTLLLTLLTPFCGSRCASRRRALAASAAGGGLRQGLIPLQVVPPRGRGWRDDDDVHTPQIARTQVMTRPSSHGSDDVIITWQM